MSKPIRPPLWEGMPVWRKSSAEWLTLSPDDIPIYEEGGGPSLILLAGEDGCPDLPRECREDGFQRNARKPTGPVILRDGCSWSDMGHGEGYHCRVPRSPASDRDFLLFKRGETVDISAYFEGLADVPRL